jgi:hypothetical protein
VARLISYLEAVTVHFVITGALHFVITGALIGTAPSALDQFYPIHQG